VPLYEYLCREHGRFEGWATMDKRHDLQKCPKCPSFSRFVVSAPRVFCDYPAYISPATGELVEGRRARQNDLAKSGCRPYEPGEMKDAQNAQKLQDAQLDAKIDEAVERTAVELKNG